MYESMLNFPSSLFGEFERLRRELDDVFGVSSCRGTGVRPDGDQARMAQPETLERVRSDDLARAGAADESLHASVGVHDRVIPQMRGWLA